MQEKLEPNGGISHEEIMDKAVQESAYLIVEEEKQEERQQAEPVNQKSGDKNIKVSVIIPSYNKYEYVCLSLHCLTRQTFHSAQFEVILIDDCSTDETPRLKNEFVSDFTFKYIRPHTNLGRSRARNLGIENSEGEVVIFMDAEMLTERNFIEEHYKHHIHESNVVVTGAMHYRGVYTFLTPLFNESQWSYIDGFLPRSAYFAGRYYEYKATHRNELTYFPLAGKEDIHEGRIHDISFPNWYLTSILNSGLSHFGENLNGFALPYIAFLTGDVSVKKAMLYQTVLMNLFKDMGQKFGSWDTDCLKMEQNSGWTPPHFVITRSILPLQET
ncbi:glycosyltransferase family A protein [Bacillus sp. OV322]|uniref:glycosyltransferase family A protein n=1 Tax=Bacillus sp. OV322 TaxID=1882764 RepID=UPI00114D4114|nr:glycosyltransferase family A protein [Bacillus sp. OV322]